MRKSLVVFALIAIVALFCSVSSAAVPPGPYLLTSDDNPTAGGNSASAFSLNTKNGKITFLAELLSGGTGLGGGFFGATGTAIESNGSCVFMTDTGSDDIAAFTISKQGVITHVTPNVGIPGMFSGNLAGGSITLSPNGKFLASANSGLENISMWEVGAGCVLTHLADYVPSIGMDLFGFVGFTPNGKGLVVPAVDFEAVELFSVAATGVLKDVGNVGFSALAACADGCFPTGMDFTADSAVVVFGNATTAQNTVLSLNLGAKGLTNPQVWPIASCPSSCGNPNVPFFSQAGVAGKGELYVGMSGYGPALIPSGEVTMNFTESPLNIVEEGTGTEIVTPDEYLGAVRTTGATGTGTGGGIMVFAVYPNLIQTAGIGAGGKLVLGPVATDPNGFGLLSLSLFPNTR
ncbi:MAG: hypothetical protein ACLP6G_02445 [Terriglobales bacterium]